MRDSSNWNKLQEKSLEPAKFALLATGGSSYFAAVINYGISWLQLVRYAGLKALLDKRVIISIYEINSQVPSPAKGCQEADKITRGSNLGVWPEHTRKCQQHFE